MHTRGDKWRMIKYSVNSEVMCCRSGCEAAVTRPEVLREGLFIFECGGISARDQPSLWPSRTRVVHPMVTESACERNYSSFASLGVRRRDPAYRSGS